jgi:hypothetical protein
LRVPPFNFRCGSGVAYCSSQFKVPLIGKEAWIGRVSKILGIVDNDEARWRRNRHETIDIDKTQRKDILAIRGIVSSFIGIGDSEHIFSFSNQ